MPDLIISIEDYFLMHGVPHPISPENLKAGIKVVIFGIFWIEALSNFILREAVINESKDSSFGNACWQILRRAALSDKIELLFVLATESIKTRYCDLFPEFKKVLELRNRLAHFKDSDTQVTRSIACLEEVVEIMASKNDPPLIQELKSPLILAHSEIILGMSNLLRRQRKIYEKRRNVKVRKLKLAEHDHGMQE